MPVSKVEQKRYTFDTVDGGGAAALSKSKPNGDILTIPPPPSCQKVKGLLSFWHFEGAAAGVDFGRWFVLQYPPFWQKVKEILSYWHDGIRTDLAGGRRPLRHHNLREGEGTGRLKAEHGRDGAERPADAARTRRLPGAAPRPRAERRLCVRQRGRGRRRLPARRVRPLHAAPHAREPDGVLRRDAEAGQAATAARLPRPREREVRHGGIRRIRGHQVPDAARRAGGREGGRRGRGRQDCGRRRRGERERTADG